MNWKQATYGLILLFVAMSILLSVQFVAAAPVCSDQDTAINFRFFDVENQGTGNLRANISVGSGTIYASNVWIPLRSNGQWIQDSGFTEDVQGIAVQRLGNGRVHVLLYGSHPLAANNTHIGIETLAVEILLRNNTLATFQNDLNNAVTFPHEPNPLENQGNWQFTFDGNDDEIYYTLGDSHLIWYSTVVMANDGFFITLNCNSSGSSSGNMSNNMSRLNITDVLIYDEPQFSILTNYTQRLDEALCSQQWQCYDWSSCNNNVQTRTCEDVAKCSLNLETPITMQFCENEDVSGISVSDSPKNSILNEFLFGGVILLLVLFVLIYFLR